MSKSKIIFYSLLHALGVLAYIVAIGLFIQALNTILPGPDGFGTIIPVLLLLVFSAAVMAILVFGRPVYLFLNGMKTESIYFLGYTMIWLLIIIIVVFSLFVTYYNSHPYTSITF